MADIVIDKNKILEAAKKCPQAKETLKILFPEVFEESKYLDLSKLEINSKEQLFKSASIKQVSGINSDFMCIRSSYEYMNKGFWLSSLFDWEIVRDSHDMLVLLPTKKIIT
jgi:hypothetical protein